MIRLEAQSIGPIAREILHETREVEVLAGFDGGFYLVAREGAFCVASPKFGEGPLNLLTPLGSGRGSALAGLTVETKGQVRDGQVFVGDELSIGFGAAQTWTPPPWPSWDRAAVAAGLAALDALAPSRLPKDGVAALAFAPSAPARSPVAIAARDQIAAIDAGLSADHALGVVDEATRRSAMLLLGFGPGFVPAGDGLLSGILLGLTACGLDHTRDILWGTLEPELPELTGEVSAMQLAAAADGLAGAEVHHVANAVMVADGGALPDLLDAMEASGHGEGWNTLGGIVLAWRAALRGAAA